MAEKRWSGPDPRPSRRRLFGSAFALLGLVAGCAVLPRPHDRSDVSAKLAERTGHALAFEPPPSGVLFTNGIALENGLSEEAAVLIGLWNNAAFQELLADLGLAAGDLIQAGLLPNPEVVYFFPVTDKPFKYAFDLPIEAFWLRPIRLRIAAHESSRVAERLTQAALDLIRDVRQAYADVLLAEGRRRVGDEAVRLRRQIANVALARLDAGDISPREVATARIDALQAEQDAARLGHDVALAEERLRNLLGLGNDRSTLVLLDTTLNPSEQLPADRLVEEAIAARPDLRAAQENIASARERLALTRQNWFRLLLIADATSGKNGHEFGPAFRAVLPLFNCNEGNIARAEAEVERAERQQVTVRNQIVFEVRAAALRLLQAKAELAVLEGKVRPEVEKAIDLANRAYREGDAPYVVVLETTRQLIDARFRQEQLLADLRRANAELERSVGRRLVPKEPAP